MSDALRTPEEREAHRRVIEFTTGPRGGPMRPRELAGYVFGCLVIGAAVVVALGIALNGG